MIQQIENISDTAKLVTATTTPVLSMFGVPIEQWVFVLSAILTVLFIVEKLPKALDSVRRMYRWMRGDRDEPSK